VRILAHIGVAWAVMLVAGAAWPFEKMAPDLPLVFAAYLGVTARDRVPHATMGAIAIGYLADLLSGTPRGLLALVCGLICLGGRLVSSRLLVRGRGFVAAYAGANALGAAILLAAIRVYLGVPLGGLGREVLMAVTAALLTALVAAPLFRLCREVDARLARTVREREAVLEGYLS